MSQESNPFTASETTSPPMKTAGNPYQSPTVVDTLQPTGAVPNPETLRSTRTGLFTVYYGICVMLFGIILGAVIMISSAMMGGPLLAVVGGVLIVGGMIIGSFAILVGQAFCLTVPRESGAKGLIQATVGMQVLAILLAFGMVAISAITVVPNSGQVTTAMMIGSNVMSVANGILGLSSFVCFLFFLKRAANYIQRPDLTRTASTVMKMVAATVISYFLVIALAVGAGMMGGGGIASVALFGIFMIIVFLIGLVTFVLYGNLVGALARAMPK